MEGEAASPGCSPQNGISVREPSAEKRCWIAATSSDTMSTMYTFPIPDFGFFVKYVEMVFANTSAITRGLAPKVPESDNIVTHIASHYKTRHIYI